MKPIIELTERMTNEPKLHLEKREKPKRVHTLAKARFGLVSLLLDEAPGVGFEPTRPEGHGLTGPLISSCGLVSLPHELPAH